MRLRTLLQLLSGAALLGTLGCVNPEDLDQDGYSPRERDCDDANPSIYPGAKEIPGNTADENCNGQGDADLDGDGFSADGTLGGKPDCDDHRSNTYPGAPESPDGKSQDCDNLVDNNLPGFDDDSDGFSEAIGDCNDANPAVFPTAAEVENGIDDNCNGKVDELTPNEDDDHDGLSELEGDCNDSNPSVFPGAPETGFQSGYDGDKLDNDCDGTIDEGTRFFDDDGDGFSENGMVGGDADCNDFDSTVYPGALEDFTDGIDSDCDGSIETSPSDGPKPIGFTDVLAPPPSPKANLGEGVDAPECKDPAFVNGMTPFFPLRVYPVRFIDIKDSAGSPQYDGPALADQLISQANKNFSGTGIRFIFDGYQEHLNNQYTNLVQTAGSPEIYDAICDLECGGCPNGYACSALDGRIVVLLVNSIVTEWNGSPMAAAGVATLPGNSMAGIALERSSNQVKNDNVFSHELGHYFGMNHTHHHTEIPNHAQREFVNRAPEQCYANGDGFCDTPADPGPGVCGSTAACQPDCGGAADEQGALWQPDTANIMSYYHCQNGAHFSQEQLKMAICTAQFSKNRATLSHYDSSCLPTCCDKESPTVLGSLTPEECREKGAAACLPHSGTESILAQGVPVYQDSTVASCVARCLDSTLITLPGAYACHEGCIDNAKEACETNGGTIRVSYGDQRVWCKFEGCQWRCNGQDWEYDSSVGIKDCRDTAEMSCGGANNIDWYTYCWKAGLD